MTELRSGAEPPATSYSHRENVAYIVLNRPHAHNALTPALLASLLADLDRAVDDPETRAVVLRGAGGRAFSAGVDLRFFSEQGIMTDPGKSLEFTAFIRDVLLRVEEVELPTVAVVEGFALAGGLELALACDIIVCSDECRIGDQHSNYDLMPGAGGTQRLPRRVGRQRALELLYTGRHLGGHEAVAIGLALESHPTDRLDAALEDLLGRLRGKSRHGLAAIKQAVRRGLELPIRDGLDVERLVTQEYFSRYPDALAGLSAFMTRPRAGSD